MNQDRKPRGAVRVPTAKAVTGLTRGQTYTFTVSATDAASTGPASVPSNAITP